MRVSQACNELQVKTFFRLTDQFSIISSEISGSDNGEYEDDSLQGCFAV